MKLYLAILATLFPLAAHAAEEYSVPWFVDHPASRQRHIQACRNDYRLVQDATMGPICANAEAAETRIYARRLSSSFNELDTAQWWNARPAMRAGLMQACARRAEYDRQQLRYCHLLQPGTRS